MKNTLKIFALLLTLSTIYSCSSSVEDELMNTWIATSVSVSGCPDSEDNETLALDEEICSDPTVSCSYISFSFDDGTLTAVQSFVFFNEIDTETNTGPYELIDDQLTLCVDGDCLTFTLEIDGDRMTLTILDSEEFDGCDVVYNFKKK